jgi:hypothetical protein
VIWVGLDDNLPVLAVILVTQIYYLWSHVLPQLFKSIRLRNWSCQFESLLPFPVWDQEMFLLFFYSSPLLSYYTKFLS